mmetsp:Transcript_17520/g.52399  ORF Transcript_17520/g.52399 Transcript_17520/m.52399 type:complete len:107 (-) Transcript_17520:169-489(-)
MRSVKNNVCVRATTNGRSDASCCSDAGYLVSARIIVSGEFTPISSGTYKGVGPIHMTRQPNGNIAITSPSPTMLVAPACGHRLAVRPAQPEHRHHWPSGPDHQEAC